MENFKVLNWFSELYKVGLGQDNSIKFYFSDLSHWVDAKGFGVARQLEDYHEVIEVFFDQNITDFYWKIHRYTGQSLFLQVENQQINIWKGLVSVAEEDWETFDDIEDIEFTTYKYYTVEKTLEEWKRAYHALVTHGVAFENSRLLPKEKHRAAVKDEIKHLIDIRVQVLKNLGHTIDHKLLDQVYDVLNHK